MTIGLKVGISRLLERLPFCDGGAVGDVESDTGVVFVCRDPAQKEFLIHMTDFVASQMRDQTRFFREHLTHENLLSFHGTLSRTQFAVYPMATDTNEGLEGLFLLMMWDRAVGNGALVDIHVRNILPHLVMDGADKDSISRLRRESWDNGTSGLLVQMRKVSNRPPEQRVVQTLDELLPFEQDDSVLRLLGVIPDASEEGPERLI